MTVLILGILLWFVSHLFKRLAPDMRAAMGDKGKGLVALLSLAAIVLMVIGYRGADIVVLYTPLPGAGHLNNLLMLIAIQLFGVGSKGSWLASRMRHPMLTATKIWALAHLLVNGDLASLVLFGSMLVWAVLSVILINRAGPWERPAPVSFGRRDVILIVAWLAAYGLIAWVHIWLGHNPFLGSYP